MSNRWWTEEAPQLPSPSTPPPPPPPPPPLPNPNPNPLRHRPHRRPSFSKPKPPLLLSHESTSSLHTYLLHLPSGTDIPLSLSLFSSHRHLSLSILSATGSISSATLLLPSTSSPLLLHGHFQLLSLSGSFFPGPSPPPPPPPLTVYLTGPHSQLIGGIVLGSLVSSGPVSILAATFSAPTFDRLPLPDDDHDVAGVVSDHLPEYPPPPPPLLINDMQVGHASLPWLLPRCPF